MVCVARQSRLRIRSKQTHWTVFQSIFFGYFFVLELSFYSFVKIFRGIYVCICECVHVCVLNRSAAFVWNERPENEIAISERTTNQRMTSIAGLKLETHRHDNRRQTTDVSANVIQYVCLYVRRVRIILMLSSPNVF